MDEAKDSPMDEAKDSRTEEERREEMLSLLNATHEFPCPFVFKVIGQSSTAFVAKIVAIVRNVLELEEDPPFETRDTPNGEHTSITMEPEVNNAEVILEVYEQIQEVEGVVMVM